MYKRLYFLIAIFVLIVSSAVAQVTTSGINGKISDGSEDIIGATVIAKHLPSGTIYRTVTNVNGRYSITGMRPGGPYEVEISYIGYQGKKINGLTLTLGQNSIVNATLKEGAEILDEVVVSGSRTSNMRTDRAGAVTSVDAEKIAMIPTVSRSMNDIMKLTPTGANIGSGFAVGGGNYRQSYVTVDGAAFNNSFGIGGNLPAGGSPISLDALDQITVSTTPFDVRQSGFTGGSISAVTKSGTNEFKGTAYMYTRNNHLTGNKVADYELTRSQGHNTVYGLSVGGPIIKDKLFFFVNGEYTDEISAGPTYRARNSDSEEWKTSGQVRRPTVQRMDEIRNFLIQNYNYDPGRYQNYSLETPAYKLLARLDYNINENNKVNVRFSTTHTKDSNNPSASTTPLRNNIIYGSTSMARGSNYAIPFESARYFQEKNFTSLAAEWNAKWGNVNNVLRATYSYQDEPRSYEGGPFPTVDILEDKGCYTTFGPDPFTEGNLRQVKTFVATDEVTWTMGKNNFLAGLQFETNEAVNGFAQAANGYYVFSSWEDFTQKKPAAAFGFTFNNSDPTSIFKAKFKYNQFSAYIQDQINISENFRITAGLRFELPIYPELENNYNSAYADLMASNNYMKAKNPDGTYSNNNGQLVALNYTTDQLPSSKITVSPRVGFNWDITGDRKYVLRGGIGYFVGRVPMVWLVSAVGNSNCGQTQYYYNTIADAKDQPQFVTNRVDLVKQLPSLASGVTAPASPTILDKDFKNPGTIKASLGFDVKLPGDIDFSVEGIYSREINPAVVRNDGRYWDGAYITLTPNDKRKYYMQYGYSNNGKWVNNGNTYVITNGGKAAYYTSITASLAKKFDFGLDLSASYTFARSKAYGDGVGDQVNSAYYNNRYSINGANDCETGFGNFVSPNRVIATAAYKLKYRGGASTFGLMYEGMNVGYGSDGYNGARTSYTLTSNVVNDYGASGLLYIPSSRAELDSWTFNDVKSGDDVYTAAQQKDDFWAYIEQDSYLSGRKGKYTERGGVVMPWHHQLDFKFTQDFSVKAGKYNNTLQLGVDVRNVLNLINSDWGLYKRMNNMSLLKYNNGKGENGSNGTFEFQKNGTERLTSTWSDYRAFGSTYSVQFSVRYIFN